MVVDPLCAQRKCDCGKFVSQLMRVLERPRSPVDLRERRSHIPERVHDGRPPFALEPWNEALNGISSVGRNK